MQEAEQAQQQAERRHGAEAIPRFQRAAELYQNALASGMLDADSRANALMQYSDALQKWAQRVLEAEADLPDEQQSAAVEAAAKATAMQLLDSAIQVALLLLIV